MELFHRVFLFSILQMDGNEISTISAGTFVNLTKLVNLSISFNELKHIREDAFVGLTSLQRLRLTKNQFSKLADITPSLVGLPQLRELVLSDNTLIRINSADFDLLVNSSIQVVIMPSVQKMTVKVTNSLPGWMGESPISG